MLIRLVDGNSIPAGVPYATLSHCWGTTRMPALRNANEALYFKAIPWKAFTKTFQEAVAYTHRLGIGYLWIDAFCINQDSFVDWLSEALSMASIFSNAMVNIAATSSPDGDGGLFLAKNHYLANGCLVDTQWTGVPGGKYVVFEDTAWRRNIDESVLNHRA